MAQCEECKTEEGAPCVRCKRDFCPMHTPDGELCVGCFALWTKEAGKGSVILPLLTFALFLPLVILLNLILAGGLMIGFVVIGVSVQRSFIPGKRKNFIAAGQPQLPKATIAP